MKGREASLAIQLGGPMPCSVLPKIQRNAVHTFMYNFYPSLAQFLEERNCIPTNN